MSECETTVCVLGGGPAGATIARRLAQLGHAVCLVERDAFPRPHVGESLAPGILPLLEALGLRVCVEAAGFLRPERALVRWAAALDQAREQPGPPGFQVDRGRFDQILLEAAVAVGVRVIQPALALRPDPDGQGWRIPLRRAGRAEVLGARFLVDATGRAAVLGGSKRRSGAATIALYGYWRASGQAGPETRVEAGRDAWFWGAPLPDGSFNATVFVDPQTCVGARGSGLEALYRALLAESALLRGCLRGQLCGPVRACDATARHDQDPVCANALKVGEAACAIDPLASQGVQAAMASAQQGAAVVHTLLTAPAHAAAAVQFYRDRQAETATRHRAYAARFYAEHQVHCGRPFWLSRAGDNPAPDPPTERPVPHQLHADTKVALADQARLELTPCLDGNLIRSLPALCHPALDRPVAFLDAVAVAPLLSDVVPGDSIGTIVRRWARELPLERSLALMRWMLGRGILVPWIS
jgi:flavin-dependent dehydrogenase